MMADITFRQGDFEGALNLYNELLTRDPSKRMLWLFSVQFDTRRQWLVFTLDAPCILNCHVALRVGIFPSSLSPAAYYLAMMRFIEAARRCGKLTLVPPILEQAEKHSNRAKYESGLFFCKGLYEWHTGLGSVLALPNGQLVCHTLIGYFLYSVHPPWTTLGNSNEAIKHFYSIRYDSALGRQATYHIIEICVNPDNQTFGGEVFENLNTNLK